MKHKGIILGMGWGNERPCYFVTSSLIGWGHKPNDVWIPTGDGVCGLAYWTHHGSMWIGVYVLSILQGTSMFLECVEWQAYRRNFQSDEYLGNLWRDDSVPKMSVKLLVCVKNIWVRSWRCSCLVNWFCYHLMAKTGNKTAAVPWPDSYEMLSMFREIAKWNMWCSKYIHRNLYVLLHHYQIPDMNISQKYVTCILCFVIV